MKVYLASDHAGFELKQELSAMLECAGYEIIDKGAFVRDPNDDYPDFIRPVAEEVSADQEARGIIIGASGQGEAMVANRISGVRAFVYYGEAGEQTDADGNALDMVSSARAHNDANIISLGARFVSEDDAKKAVHTFLDTLFSGEERHTRRINKLDEIINQNSFDTWNEIKKKTNDREDKVYFRERDVFYIQNGKNIGSEQNGYGTHFARPVVVLKKINKHVFVGVPLTTKRKDIPAHFPLTVQGKKASALLSQVRTFDSKRILDKIDTVPSDIFSDLQKEISAFLLR